MRGIIRISLVAVSSVLLGMPALAQEICSLRTMESLERPDDGNYLAFNLSGPLRVERSAYVATLPQVNLPGGEVLRCGMEVSEQNNDYPRTIQPRTAPVPAGFDYEETFGGNAWTINVEIPLHEDPTMRVLRCSLPKPQPTIAQFVDGLRQMGIRLSVRRGRFLSPAECETPRSAFGGVPQREASDQARSAR